MSWMILENPYLRIEYVLWIMCAFISVVGKWLTRPRKRTASGLLRIFVFTVIKHPQTLGASDVDAFLSSLAVEKLCAVNTQKTALNALVFMYKRVLGCDLGILQFSPSSRPNVASVVI